MFGHSRVNFICKIYNQYHSLISTELWYLTYNDGNNIWGPLSMKVLGVQLGGLIWTNIHGELSVVVSKISQKSHMIVCTPTLCYNWWNGWMLEIKVNFIIKEFNISLSITLSWIWFFMSRIRISDYLSSSIPFLLTYGVLEIVAWLKTSSGIVVSLIYTWNNKLNGI